MKPKITSPGVYDPFLIPFPLQGKCKHVDISSYTPHGESEAKQPLIQILNRNGGKTGFVGLPQINPDSPWNGLTANDTRTRELTPDEFAEWARRSLWKATRPNGMYRSCPHEYCVSAYEDTPKRYEFECAAKTIHFQGRGMIFTTSRNVWSYHFPGDGYYYWGMDACWKRCNLINRAEIAKTVFLRKTDDPDWHNGRDDLCLRTHTNGTFLERFGFDKLARFHSGTIKPIEVRRFGTDEVKIYDYEEVTS